MSSNLQKEIVFQSNLTLNVPSDDYAVQLTANQQDSASNNSSRVAHGITVFTIALVRAIQEAKDATKNDFGSP
jgi:hypothetical protein